MTKPIIFVFALVITWCFPIPPGNGCKCDIDAPFLSVAARDQLIAVVVVESHYSKGDIVRAVNVKIDRVLSGSEKKKQIRIWGDDGHLCRPYAAAFFKKTRWVMALRPNSNPDENTSDYALSICGEYWLSCTSDSVFGRIDADSLQRLDWKTFEQKLKTTLGPH